MPHRLRRAVGLALAAVAFAVAPRAQEAPTPDAREITFNEALSIALRQNTALQQAENVAEGRGLAVSQARSTFLPDLSAAVRPTRRYGLVFDQTTGQLDQETSQSLDASVTTSLNLFNGFGDVAALREARLNREAAEFALVRAQQDVLFDVASEFLRVILDQELVRIQAETLEAEQAQRDRIDQLVEGGVRPRADAFQQAAIVAERELELLQAEAQLELAKTRLVQTLQLDPFEAYTFVAPSLEAASLDVEAYDLEVLLTAALEQREDLQAQALQIEAAEASIDVAQSGYWPTVNLFASFGSSYSSLATRTLPNTVRT
ncbi:MAG: TolC family protein, partial [Rhodothermales bacterium]|nr:TolC family protein [Rhodothermales bacterium]